MSSARTSFTPPSHSHYCCQLALALSGEGAFIVVTNCRSLAGHCHLLPCRHEGSCPALLVLHPLPVGATTGSLKINTTPAKWRINTKVVLPKVLACSLAQPKRRSGVAALSRSPPEPCIVRADREEKLLLHTTITPEQKQGATFVEASPEPESLRCPELYRHLITAEVLPPEKRPIAADMLPPKFEAKPMYLVALPNLTFYTEGRKLTTLAIHPTAWPRRGVVIASCRRSVPVKVCPAALESTTLSLARVQTS